MNFDPMTGEPIKKNFDPMTGEPINQEQQPEVTAAPEEATESATAEQTSNAATEVLTNNTAEQPAMSFDPMTGQPMGMEPKKKGFLKSTASKVVLAVAVIAVVACGAAALAFSGVFASKSDKVLSAIKNTIADKGELVQAFEVGDILNSNEYTMGFSMEAEGVGMDISYLCGKAGKQINGTVDIAYASSIDFAMALTEEELQVQIPYISDKVFTYNYKGKNTGYLMEELGSEEDIEALNTLLEYFYNAKTNTESSKEFYNVLLDEYKTLEFEEVKAAKFEVDGKDRACEGYETVITKENIRNLLDAYEESASEELEELEELMLDLDPSYTAESYAESFDELREELEDMPDVTVTFYLYDKKLACIELQPKGENAVQIQFLGGDRRAQNMRIVDEDGYVMLEVVGEKDGSTENFELFVAEMSVLSFEYDSKSGDFSLYSDEISLSGTIESDRNGLTVVINEFSDEYDSYEFEGSITLEKGADFQELDGDKFDIGNASEDEVVDLMTEISDSLY